MRRKRIHTRNADTVQTTRDFVRTFVELTSSVEHSHHHLERADAFFFVDVHGNTATIVLHHNRIIFADGHFNVSAVACQSLVDGVIHRFIDQVMQTFFADVANVHRRALANGFKPFEHLNIGCGIPRWFLFFFFHTNVWL